MKSTEQLELETEEARTRVAHRLDELRARATPGQVVDQLIDYARASDGAEFADNLRRQVVANPLPVILLGTSIAWLATARSHGGMRTRDRSAVRDAAPNAAQAARESADDTLRDARAHAEDMSESASETLDSVRERASDAYASASSRIRNVAASVEHAAPKLREGVASAGQSFVALCKEQPIALAGIGLAIGATIGALLPQTSLENRVIGLGSDDIKERARRMSAKVNEAAESVYGEAKDAFASAIAQDDAAVDRSGTTELGHS